LPISQELFWHLPKNTINRLLEIKTELGYIRDSDFASFLEKQPADIDKYLKGTRNVGLKFIQHLKSKIPKLNDQCFFDENEPLFIDTLSHLKEVDISQPEPLSGGNLAALEEYRNKCADLQKENDRLKAKINKLENLNFALIEYVHNYLQTTNNLKHPANERTKKQPTLVKSG